MDQALLKLSPTGAADFKSCPQLFKFRAVDRLPEPVSPAAVRGSLVHAVLEQLFSLAPAMRTPSLAEGLLNASWKALQDDPELQGELEGCQQAEWFAQARKLLHNYFKLEDPRAVQARRMEWWVEYELPEIHLRGIIDRLEQAPDGSWVLTDYKTGRTPGEARELVAFFGLRFYALVCWRAFGVIAKEIRLVYLQDPAVLTLNPHERMLVAFEHQMQALGKAVRRAQETNDWRPRPSPFCMSCPFHSMCPAWG